MIFTIYFVLGHLKRKKFKNKLSLNQEKSLYKIIFNKICNIFILYVCTYSFHYKIIHT